MKKGATENWHKESVVKLEKMIKTARDNVMAHMSDMSAQTIFMILSQFLGVPPQLESVRTQDHSTKMQALGQVVRLATAIAPVPYLSTVGVVAKTSLDVSAKSHAMSVRKGTTPQTHAQASGIEPLAPEDISADMTQAGRQTPASSSSTQLGIQSTGTQPVPQRLFQDATGQFFYQDANGQLVPAAGHRVPQQMVLQQQMMPQQQHQQQMTTMQQQTSPQQQLSGSSYGHNQPITAMQHFPDAASSARTTAQKAMAAKKEVEPTEEISEEERRKRAIRKYQMQRLQLQTAMILKVKERQAVGVREGKGQTSANVEGFPVLETKKRELADRNQKHGTRVWKN